MKNFLIKILFLIAILLLFPLYSKDTLSDQFKNLEKGDYVLYEHKKLQTLLIVREKIDNHLIFEEISSPKVEFPLQKWLSAYASNKSSWYIFSVNLETKKLSLCYDPIKQEVFSTEGSFFQKFLSLPLTYLESNRDKRLWRPPVTFEGEKKNTNLQLYQMRWPKDGSILEKRNLELYFSPLSFFPCWIDISSSASAQIIRALDMGKNLISPIKTSPFERPSFSSSFTKQKEGITLPITNSAFIDRYQLYALELGEIKTFIPLSFTLEKEAIFIANNELKQKLKEKKHYLWMLISKEDPLERIEHPTSFLCQLSTKS